MLLQKINISNGILSNAMKYSNAYLSYCCSIWGIIRGAGRVHYDFCSVEWYIRCPHRIDVEYFKRLSSIWLRYKSSFPLYTYGSNYASLSSQMFLENSLFARVWFAGFDAIPMTAGRFQFIWDSLRNRRKLSKNCVNFN